MRRIPEESRKSRQESITGTAFPAARQVPCTGITSLQENAATEELSRIVGRPVVMTIDEGNRAASFHDLNMDVYAEMPLDQDLETVGAEPGDAALRLGIAGAVLQALGHYVNCRFMDSKGRPVDGHRTPVQMMQF